MFEQLSEKLETVFKKLRGQGTLTEENIRDSLREVRRALLEADVHFTVAKEFVRKVEEKAVGQEVLRSLSPGQQVIQVVHDVLVEVLGQHRPGDRPVQRDPDPDHGGRAARARARRPSWPSSGHYLRKHKKVPVLAACDVYRPAAMDQLATLAQGGRASGCTSRRAQTDAVGHRARGPGTARKPSGRTTCSSTRPGGCTSTSR